ncbi:MAG TPA: hypothetical protein ENH41_01270 [Candidatus Omnitrophica bacterium]|nr:hypothetical protein [Candidatus Omnitrophota bacterium]
MKKNKTFIKKSVCVFSFFLLMSGFVGLRQTIAAESVTFKVIVLNPSATKTQTTEIKKYLPQEVTPKDIIDLGGLELEYDTNKSLYYVYKKQVELIPKEISTFEIEVRDIWIVSEDKLSIFSDRVDSILRKLEDSEYYQKAKDLADTIYPRLNEIRTQQSDESLSRQRHIGAYRASLITLEEIEKDVLRMEKILVTAGGPPAPEMLADSKIKADAPSKTMTWIVIFSIIVFSGLLSAVLFFTWHRQAQITKDSLLHAKESAFGEKQTEKEPKSDKQEG